MWIRSLLLFCFLLLGAGPSEGQYRNYSLRCLAPIIENIDPNAPNTLQEAFLAGPKQFAKPLEGVGAEAISFPISTDSEEAQLLFEQGVALLHVLSYKEAERAFRTVVELDPDCPMGYWGLAQANERIPQRARIFSEEARDRCDRNRPEIEQRWTALLADFYSNPDGDLSVRSSSRVHALEDLTLDFPEDREVRAFLLRRLTLDQFFFGLPVTSTLGVDALAEDFATEFPDHPSRHYRVFLWLNRQPERLLDEAREMTRLSPRVPEIWRYSAEAYAAAAHSVDAVILGEAALRTEHTNLAERNLMPWQSENLSENYGALVDMLIGAGRIDDAIVWTKRALALPNRLVQDGAGAETLWMKARFSAGQWETFLGELESDPILLASETTSTRAMRLSWKGISQLALGQPEEAASTMDLLAILEREAIIDGISSFDENSIVNSRRMLGEIQRLFETGPESRTENPLGEFDLPTLAKARLLELSGKAGEAYSLLKTKIEERPNRWFPTAEFCRLAKHTGHEREALYPIDRRFRSDASLADSDLDVFEDLELLATQLRMPEEWRILAPKTDLDISLKTLGPETWKAPSAPDFELVDRLGRSWSLAEFSGRPVLIHFFLGVQCAFCLEQFDTFRPHLPDFAEAGIDILAITIDSEDNLKKFLGEEKEVNSAFRDSLSFPVLADPDLNAFRKYGVFDEFENGPMHATVLVGPDGRILWRNIGHTPFKEPTKLLHEAERLFRVRDSVFPQTHSPVSDEAASTDR